MMIKVKAAKGIPVHFPLGVKAAPGARTLVLTGDTTIEVDDSHRFVRRRIKAGDLVLVKTTKKPRKPDTDTTKEEA